MRKTDLAYRSELNPLIKPQDLAPMIPGMEIACIFNPGVFRFNNKTCLLLRVAERPIQTDGEISIIIRNSNGQFEKITFRKSDPDLDAKDPRVIRYKGQDYLTTLSYQRLLFSDDNIHFYEDINYPPIFGEGQLESFGIEDCRVSYIDGKFNLTYSAISPVAVGIGLMQTTDWQHFDRKGLIFPPHNKDCAFFEEKINGTHYALHRPSCHELGGNYIWIAQSPDLVHWGQHKCIALTRPGMWDEARIGAGASPIKTSEGWLVIYHGATYDNRYCLGAMLLDLNDPSVVLSRSIHPIMEPLEPYEKTGFFGEVIFSNGHYLERDTIHLYYGASDEIICYARMSVTEIVNNLKGN